MRKRAQEIECISFSVYEFARRHSVTPQTIYGEIRRGDLPAMHIGKGDLRITKDHEAEWLKRKEVDMSKPKPKKPPRPARPGY